ncbi:phage tail protein [Psychromonas hadalis]|uniref:phage tail protein n=1 Tax=Psychromonas hadalis TaxID=211669 RepID=UPI0003B4E5C0|nr:phage tail protein [Psychromonas hadalis]
MEYLQSLTKHLIKNLVKKDDLEAWAEGGELIASSHQSEDGFETQYTCCFEMSNVEIEPKRLFMLVLSWLNKVNPERDSQGLARPQFFNEPLAKGRYDLGIKIEFREQFDFTPDPQGDWEVNGVLMSLKSDFDNLLDVDQCDTLKIVDSHTQDNSLQN